MVGRNSLCSYPPPRSWHPQGRSEDGSACSFFLSFGHLFPSSFPWCASYLLGTGLGGGQKGSLQRAALRGLWTGNSGIRYAAIV